MPRKLKLSDDGKYVEDVETGTRWDATTGAYQTSKSGLGVDSPIDPSELAALKSPAAATPTFKKGGPMPTQASAGANFGRDMRLWRAAQGDAGKPIPAAFTATDQSKSLRKKEEKK